MHARQAVGHASYARQAVARDRLQHVNSPPASPHLNNTSTVSRATDSKSSNEKWNTPYAVMTIQHIATTAADINSQRRPRPQPNRLWEPVEHVTLGDCMLPASTVCKLCTAARSPQPALHGLSTHGLSIDSNCRRQLPAAPFES